MVKLAQNEGGGGGGEREERERERREREKERERHLLTVLWCLVIHVRETISWTASLSLRR